MLTIHLMGGLGNQLFQVFTLIATSIKHKTSFFFLDDMVQLRNDRPFYWENFLANLAIFRRNNVVHTMYREKSHSYNAIELPQADRNSNEDINIKLFGYFQSYKYFDEYKDTLFKLIHLEEHKQGLIDKYKLNKEQFENVVSLHFRIGDYVNLPEHHPVLSLNFYKKAIDQLIQTTKRADWTILYFYETQNKDYVKNNIAVLQNTYPGLLFEPASEEMCDWEHLLTMSLCRHNIIANSSFSWWGAYMNTNNNKVFYPETWFGPAEIHKNTSDMFLSDWLMV